MIQATPPKQVGERIEQLLEEISRADPSTSSRAEELVGLLVRMYGDGLERIITTMETSEVESLAASDSIVSGLLVLHDLHPLDTETRVGAALDTVRPYLGSHAGGVSFVGIDEAGVAHLQLEGSCDGCPASAVTVKMAIEGAIMEAAPEVASVSVEGVVDHPTKPEPSPVLLQIGQKPQPKTVPRWVPVEGAIPASGSMELKTLDGFGYLVAVVADSTYAYRDDCPGCGAAMISGSLSGATLSCPGCGRRYDLARAGRSLDDDLLLDPIPLIAENGTAKISVPEVVG